MRKRKKKKKKEEDISSKYNASVSGLITNKLAIVKRDPHFQIKTVGKRAYYDDIYDKHITIAVIFSKPQNGLCGSSKGKTRCGGWNV